MKRTIDDIRDNLSWVGCDNETALEMCEEIERLTNRISELTGHLDWLSWSSDGVEKARAEIERLQTEYIELAAAVWVQTREEFEADQIPHSETVKEAADGARALVWEKVRGQ